jgi:hypothetical protein
MTQILIHAQSYEDHSLCELFSYYELVKGGAATIEQDFASRVLYVG